MGVVRAGSVRVGVIWMEAVLVGGKNSRLFPSPTLFSHVSDLFRVLRGLVRWWLGCFSSQKLFKAHKFGVLWTSCGAPKAAGASQDVQRAHMCVSHRFWKAKRPNHQHKSTKKPEKIQKWTTQSREKRQKKKREILDGPRKGVRGVSGASWPEKQKLP